MWIKWKSFFLGCSNYRNLTDFDRGKGFALHSSPKCDSRLRKAWYRITGAAGKQMPTQCVPTNHCGAHAPGWLSGGHPTMDEGVVHRNVCFHWLQRCCRWSHPIRVLNCDNTFYVYELSPPPTCYLRYCGDIDLGMLSILVLCRWGSSTQEFCFINGVDNVNWPDHHTGIPKADVSSVIPSSERIEELWVVSALKRRDGAALLVMT